MIDEKKVIWELEELKSEMLPESLEDRLLTGFLKYIEGQKIVDAKEYCFQRRLKGMFLLVTEAGVLQGGKDS